MAHFATVRQAYAGAWARRIVFVLIQIAMQVAALILVAPLLAGLVNLAVSLSDQSALTDQDIARFLLTPGGFVAMVVVASIFLVTGVWGFAMMAAVTRSGPAGSRTAALAAFSVVAGRAQALVIFAAIFVLRVLALVLPFVVAGLVVAWALISDYDINYYLTFHPPEFLIAMALIGFILLGLAVILLRVLSGWALSLHVVLFGGTAPRAAFAESTEMMAGRRWNLSVQLVLWFLVRFAIVSAIGVVAGLVLNLVPLQPGAGLKAALLLSLMVGGVWMLALLVLNAVTLGALAELLDRFYGRSAAAVELPASEAVSARRRLVGLGVGGLALAGVAGWVAYSLSEQVQTIDDVEVIAHRGAAGAKPENTMASFEKAIEDQADWIELDVQENADGEVVVVHDSDFMKLSGVDLKIWDATSDDLTGIDVGSWFDPSFSDQRVPHLRDVLELAKGKAKVLIELKYYGHDEKLEERVAQIVDDLEMADQVAVMSLKYPAVQKMQALRPDWRTGVLAATAVGNLAGLDGDFIAVSTSTAGPRLAASLDDAGKDLYVWTVNDPLEMSRYISMGADGLITDEPAMVRKVLEVRAGLSTAERLILAATELLGLKIDTGEYRDDQP